MKTTVKVYVPSCSAWFTAATINFLPMPEMLNTVVNMIVDAYCEDSIVCVSKSKVIVDGKVYKTFEY